MPGKRLLIVCSNLVVLLAGALAFVAPLPVSGYAEVDVDEQSKYFIVAFSPACEVFCKTEFGAFNKCTAGKKLVVIRLSGVLPLL